jgi:glucose-6-phosphate isomerase, archaeal
MEFNPGFNIKPTIHPMGFEYGPGVFGPEAEYRRLEDIRESLRDPRCQGPEIVYAIAMDVGKKEHLQQLKKLHLLFGVVTYAAGRLGKEPIRSQGHIHKVSPLSGLSTPEIYEIWSGRAIIYMQESAKDNPGRCFAVEAGPGEVVVVPPGWAHATISADPDKPLTFGAWCDRAYGFEYDDVRAHKGLAWFPVIGNNEKIEWQPNPMYRYSELKVKAPADYSCLGIEKTKPVYTQFEEDKSRFLFVSHPQVKEKIWRSFLP